MKNPFFLFLSKRRRTNKKWIILNRAMLNKSDILAQCQIYVLLFKICLPKRIFSDRSRRRRYFCPVEHSNVLENTWRVTGMSRSIIKEVSPEVFRQSISLSSFASGYLPRAKHLKDPPDYLPPFIDPQEWTLEAATFGQNDYIGQ